MYYIYLLTDPRHNDKVFYCGKGKGDRWKSHSGHWSGNGKNNPTENKIKRIQAEGLQPGVIFLHKDIEDEDLAYKLEEDYIRENFDVLTNLKVDAKPPKNTGGRTFKKSDKAKKEASVRVKKEYDSSKRIHWTKTGKFSPAEISKLISAGDPGKSQRGKKSKSRTPIVETTTNRVFSSQTEAANALNIRQADISNVLNGRGKSTKGYKFIYVKNMLK